MDKNQNQNQGSEESKQVSRRAYSNSTSRVSSCATHEFSFILFQFVSRDSSDRQTVANVKKANKLSSIKLAKRESALPVAC